MNKKYKFKKNPNFKYKFDIINDGDCLGFLEKFEVFESHKDNKKYIALIKKNIIEIFSISENKKILILKENKNTINTIRYFINNKNLNEYLISSDFDRIIIIWDILHDYSVKLKIDMQLIPDFMIYSCLLIFTQNKDDYIISTAINSEEEYDESSTKIYLFDSGEYLREIKISNNLMVYYLLSWYNKNNNNYFIVQNCNSKILINNLLEEKIYCEFNDKNESYFYKGFIYNKDNNDYLCCCSTNGYINIWDLYNKTIFKVIFLKGFYSTDIIHWNDKYIITIDNTGKNCGIVDIEHNKIISKIGNKDGFRCIKKIYHPIYGESLLTSGNNRIKLWYI